MLATYSLVYCGKILQQIKKNEENTTPKNEKRKPRCLIFDDSLLEKTGNKIEKIGKVFDHVTQRMVLGFNLLLKKILMM